MYYPYLRGKQHELAALRATAPQMARSGEIVPVVEPVSEDPARLERAATDVLQAAIPFVLITLGFGWATRSVGFLRRHIRAVNIVGGILLVVLGILMVTGVWTALMAQLQGVFLNVPLPL